MINIWDMATGESIDPVQPPATPAPAALPCDIQPALQTIDTETRDEQPANILPPDLRQVDAHAFVEAQARRQSDLV